ncbi:hypothetical protein N7G274_003650 [Stereocaulon virgatum]|uniref:Alkyl hydroperoxide reductase subunit C/ Thiol specific antioxidant domain-containing protein n=1 Tax=Stereocaulon virgatum TaxID=373712 RepID=A0ABR4ACY1_9LECA
MLRHRTSHAPHNSALFANSPPPRLLPSPTLIMTLRQELSSWAFPTSLSTSPVPTIGAKAPSASNLSLPPTDGKPTLISFLRHCGCPFAEKTFISLRSTASSNPNISCIAISHSDRSSTSKWLESIGGPGNIRIIVDPERKLYAQWGLGVSSLWHVLSPWSLWSVYQLGKEEGIWNRPTESGSRWQMSGAFAVDGEGVVRWGGAAELADWIPDFREGVRRLGREGKE